ncbi:hypothetical protein M408DRAFT_14788 [Serendipita vermifera MAFF 305830]|uniref:Glycosyltransferase 61 catalytic domain-containing protein n=1 Tax=Serendipita vermifera MAFF 305830 TaxID=933852 RepID=A0A0C2XUF2_SERVB|nr:hypothetical protein M408DRAFT_14788 [Serendipita vermifera MAFF 305830]
MVVAVRGFRIFVFLFSLLILGFYLFSKKHDHSDALLSLVNSSETSLPLAWNDNTIPETKALLHKLPGLTVFENLYAYNGTIYIVTSEPDSIPEKRMIISNGLALEFKQENEPTDQTLQIITPAEARLLFGPALAPNFLAGVSFMQTDAPQFLGHMYHFVVEIFALGHWRHFTSPDLDTTFGSTRPYPRRYIFPYASHEQWQDHAGMNLWTIRAALGPIALEFKDEWKTWMDSEQLLVMEHVVLGDRAAWHRGSFWKSPKEEFPLVVRDRWWDPIRNSVTAFVEPADVQANITQKPLITYVSRQNSRRRLKTKDHNTLVSELELLCQIIECELQVATMEELDTTEQILLLSKTTVLVGVHGNGLLGQLWMEPTPRSTVIEIFHPDGFTYDYEYTARSLGHKYYGIWKDKYFTAPDLPPQNVVDGFHGASIPVNGTSVASLIHQRLTMKSL